MKVRVRLFSVARDIAGFHDRMIELRSSSTAGSVIEMLAESNPRFTEWRRSLRIAVNQHYVSDDHPLSEGDEVAVIPPVSGG